MTSDKIQKEITRLSKVDNLDQTAIDRTTMSNQSRALIEIAYQLAKLNERFERIDGGTVGEKKEEKKV